MTTDADPTAAGGSPLSHAELVRRALAVRLVLTDCDGVLTDNGVYYSSEGEAMKRFSIRDGMGVERLRNAGIVAAIVTGEVSKSVQHRADKLSMKAYLGVKTKAERIGPIAEEHGFDLTAVAYIGDDVNDLDAMLHIRKQGLIGVPSDAMPAVKEQAHFTAQFPGGHGAFRDFAEWILALRAGNTSPTEARKPL